MKIPSVAMIGLVFLAFGLGCGRSPTNMPGAPRARNVEAYQLDLSQVEVQPPEKVPLDTVGIMFCMDVSPSMNDAVGGARKIDISKQTMKQVLAQIEGFARKNTNKKIHVGMIAFSGRADVVQPLAPFERERLERAVDSLRTGNATAIGTAMEVASAELLKAGTESKAIIVLTDGENNQGNPPHWVMQALRNNRNTRQAATDDIKVFLLAFDISASKFDEVKSAGATVLESRDRTSLEGIMTKTVEDVLLEKPN